MSFHNKDEQTHRLGRQQFAGATGESQTAAVPVAVPEPLENGRRQSRGDLADRLLAIGTDVAARLPTGLKSADHGDLLYDRNGLPAHVVGVPGAPAPIVVEGAAAREAAPLIDDGVTRSSRTVR